MGEASDGLGRREFLKLTAAASASGGSLARALEAAGEQPGLALVAVLQDNLRAVAM